MTSGNKNNTGALTAFFMRWENTGAVFFLSMGLAAGSFYFLLLHRGPARAWQAYLVNFLIWSAISQGGLLFSVVMHLTKARWSRGLCALSEGFAVFFPLSLLLFGVLFFGKDAVFPWMHQATGKEAWLNVKFLFLRDLAGLLILYGFGFLYVYHGMKLRFQKYAAGRYAGMAGRFRAFLEKQWRGPLHDPENLLRKKTVFGIFYAIFYALVLSLLGYDLVMSANPHFVSTLFGAYCFVKAFYIGLGALILVVSILHLGSNRRLTVPENQFHDLGKLFLGFCLLWADFFYCQLVVIWYGNIPEETHYLIARTMISPWKELAGFVFFMSFVLPFLVLLNKSVKARPRIMVSLCAAVIMGIWLEHVLLLGPELNPGTGQLPLGLADGLMFLGFFGAMGAGISFFLGIFPEVLKRFPKEADQ